MSDCLILKNTVIFHFVVYMCVCVVIFLIEKRPKASGLEIKKNNT